jgi:hypothetical protein
VSSNKFFSTRTAVRELMKKEGKKYINDMNLLRWPKSISNLGEAQIQSWSPAGGRTTRRGIVESLNELESFREILTEKKNVMRELSETRSGPGPKANEWLAIEELIWVCWILVGRLHAQSSDIYIYYILQHLTSRSLNHQLKDLDSFTPLEGRFCFYGDCNLASFGFAMLTMNIDCSKSEQKFSKSASPADKSCQTP